MAETLYLPAAATNGSDHTITRSSGSAVLSGNHAAVVINDASSYEAIELALKAALQVLREDRSASNLPSAFPTTGTKLV
jgi:hypothetical protein